MVVSAHYKSLLLLLLDANSGCTYSAQFPLSGEHFLQSCLIDALHSNLKFDCATIHISH